MAPARLDGEGLRVHSVGDAVANDVVGAQTDLGEALDEKGLVDRRRLGRRARRRAQSRLGVPAAYGDPAPLITGDCIRA